MIRSRCPGSVRESQNPHPRKTQGEAPKTVLTVNLSASRLTQEVLVLQGCATGPEGS